MGFTSTEKDDVVTWLGDPDCQTGHGFILERLIAASATFFTISDTSTSKVDVPFGGIAAPPRSRSNPIARKAESRPFLLADTYPSKDSLGRVLYPEPHPRHGHENYALTAVVLLLS